MLFSAISFVKITDIQYEFKIAKDIVYSCKYKKKKMSSTLSIQTKRDR